MATVSDTKAVTLSPLGNTALDSIPGSKGLSFLNSSHVTMKRVAFGRVMHCFSASLAFNT